MKLTKNGQALVEFVLVLPILLIVFAFIDFGRIILCKNHLEGMMSEVAILPEEERVNFIKKDQEYDIIYQVQEENEEIISLDVNLNLITPGLNRVLKNPYKVHVERRIINE